MKKYEVEIKALYVYAVEAKNKSEATRIAQSMHTAAKVYIERNNIASIHIEEVDSFRDPEHYHHEPPGMASWKPKP